MLGGSDGAVHGDAERPDVDRRDACGQISRQRVESNERRQYSDACSRHVW